ncbi:retroelement silencing factor 1 [Ranitomeya imitator]|uniref:retroelement silencing factor 1 n=1 Tax=Ranitomeya imitator TaxID=111125 RepID=UPI0037E800FA
MSINRMDWNRNSSGAVAHPNNQQYFQQSTSSTASTMQSQTAYIPSNFCPPAQNQSLLKGLLGAKSAKEILQIEQSALSGRQKSTTQVQQTTQVSSPGQYNNSYNLLHMTSNAANLQSGRNAQNLVLQNVQVQAYPVAFLQTFQQAQPLAGVNQQAQPLAGVHQQAQPLAGVHQQAQPFAGVHQQAQPLAGVHQQAQPLAGVHQQAQLLAGVHQQAQPLAGVHQQAQLLAGVHQQAQPLPYYGANGFNSREVQQPLQGTQSRRYSHKRTSQQIVCDYIATKHSQNTQKNYQPLMPNASYPTSYSVQNENSHTSVAPYKATSDKHVPVLTPNSQNGQNQMGSHFQTVSLTNTPQSQGNLNDYVQNSQGQTMPNFSSGFSNSSTNVLPSATGQMSTPYSQSNTNASNVYVNQAFPNLNQNVQQSYTATQDQHSVAVTPPVYSGNVPQDKRNGNMQDILALLKIYQNIKHKYLLLNRENNLLRQKMQRSSQDNSGSSTMKPPLISSLPDKTVPTNNSMGSQEDSQNSAAQNHSSATHVQNPTLYDNSLNVPVQNITHPNNSFSSYINPTNNADVLSQRNSTGFENGQVNLSTNSSGQAVGSETLQSQDPPKQSTVSIQTNNQYLPGGNVNNGTISQNGHKSSVPNIAQTATSSESYITVQTTNSSNLYAKSLLTSSSRDAIKASLPLWKSVPSETEPTQHVVNSSQNALHLLEEMAAGVTPTQKSEHSSSNASKGIEPQIAIVNPLVQIKNLANMNQCPKVIPKDEDMANNVNELKEIDCISNIILALESAKSNLDNIQPRSNMVSLSPFSVEVSSSCNVDQNATKNVESVDDGLQISGICSLVEGNSFYNSSIAMMFEDSLQTQSDSPMVKIESKDHHSMEGFLEDTNICNVSQANTLSLTTEMKASEPDLQGQTEPSVDVQDDQQGTNVYGFEMQPGQDLTASDMFGLESDTVSDQLSELLTEFPFGIKNYMSENKPESTKVSLQKTTKTEIPKSSVPFSCDIEMDGSIEESPIKYSLDMSTNEESKTEYSMVGWTNEELKTEDIVDMLTNQESKSEYTMDTSTKEMEAQKTEVKVKREPTPELPINEVTPVQFEDDCFEICDSPDRNIHITLMSKDQITEIFPEEDSAKPIVHGEESPVDHFENKFEMPVVDVAESSTKEVPDYENTQSSEMYCCVLKWARQRNKHAPKCKCKPIYMEEIEGLDMYKNAEALNTDHSTIVIEPTTAGFEPSTDRCEIMSDVIKHDEFLPPVNKSPKIEPVKVSSEGKSSPQEKNKSEKHLKENLSLKELSSDNQKILQPRSNLEDHNGKKVKDLFSGSKSKVDGPRKLEKLIIKTDFLKNKHLLKMKRKSIEKTSRVEESNVRSVQKINTEAGESPKAFIIDKIFGSKTKNAKSKSSANTPQQSERSTSKIKSFYSSDKLHSHSQGLAVGKRKERIKTRESHFERVKKVPTVQEYLERKRELCNNKRSGSKVDHRDVLDNIRNKVIEKPSMERSENNSPPILLRLLSPAKINIKTRKLEYEGIHKTQKDQPKTSRAYESLHKIHRDRSGSHGKGSLMKKRRAKKTSSGKEKIYLTPCDGTRLNSYEGISLTKLQIRCSPEKPGFFERRQSLDSYMHKQPSKPETKNEDTPKMLEFKLCPEFVNRSPTMQEKKGEPKATTERSIVEGIKSKKEAWCIGIPFKKRKIISEDQGHQSPPSSTSSINSTQKQTSRPVQDSQTTFNVFKQLYHEQRSKSLDGSL